MRAPNSKLEALEQRQVILQNIKKSFQIKSRFSNSNTVTGIRSMTWISSRYERTRICISKEGWITWSFLFIVGCYIKEGYYYKIRKCTSLNINMTTTFYFNPSHSIYIINFHHIIFINHCFIWALYVRVAMKNGNNQYSMPKLNMPDLIATKDVTFLRTAVIALLIMMRHSQFINLSPF